MTSLSYVILLCAAFVYGQSESSNSSIKEPCTPCPTTCFERGYPDTKPCLSGAYNEAANFELNSCPWNIWLDTSFTYWIAYEEGLDLAASTAYTVPSSSLYQIQTLFQPTEWKPGFKVGLGANLKHDHWSGFAEYTWFRSKTEVSATPAPGPAGSSATRWHFHDWHLQSESHYSNISSLWKLHMDLADLGITRPCYQGTHLIIAPFGGLRATWIRQNLRTHLIPYSGVGQDVPVFQTTSIRYKSNSWAIGPRGGLRGKWHLKWGFRVEGDLAAAILFTRYTTVSGFADPALTTDHYSTLNFDDYNTLRFNNDICVGLGYGSYLNCRKYHIDFLASYDFQIFWSQNMMRAIADSFNSGVGASPGNLFLQGLTLKAQLDF